MDVKEEAAKSTLGKIVAGVLVLIGLLFLIVWREALSGVWTRAEAATSKRLLEALLGLAGIAIVIQFALLYDNRRKRKLTPKPEPPTPPESKPFLMLGLLWDKQLNPLCPADQTPLSHFMHHRNGYDILRCAKCGTGFTPRDDTLGNLNLPNAKKVIQDRMQDA